jgi:hypothetical protein
VAAPVFEQALRAMAEAPREDVPRALAASGRIETAQR